MNTCKRLDTLTSERDALAVDKTNMQERIDELEATNNWRQKREKEDPPPCSEVTADQFERKLKPRKL